jgi:hypothetical protein
VPLACSLGLLATRFPQGCRGGVGALASSSSSLLRDRTRPGGTKKQVKSICAGGGGGGVGYSQSVLLERRLSEKRRRLHRIKRLLNCRALRAQRPSLPSPKTTALRRGPEEAEKACRCEALRFKRRGREGLEI